MLYRYEYEDRECIGQNKKFKKVLSALFSDEFSKVIAKTRVFTPIIGDDLFLTFIRQGGPAPFLSIPICDTILESVRTGGFDHTDAAFIADKLEALASEIRNIKRFTP